MILARTESYGGLHFAIDIDLQIARGSIVPGEEPNGAAQRHIERLVASAITPACIAGEAGAVTASVPPAQA